MTIGISDESGAILALYRMPDGTVFSSDVAMTKARNAYYFSTREGYEVLRGVVETNPYADATRWEPRAAGRQGMGRHRAHDQLRRAADLSAGDRPRRSSSSRTAPSAAGRGSISTSTTRRTPAPKGRARRAAAIVPYLNQSGIVWFPGSVPLYRGDRVIGGLGVSGDGVEQDDYVSLLGSEGFHPPDSLRVDNSVMSTASARAVRLPYLKLPRNPEKQR